MCDLEPFSEIRSHISTYIITYDWLCLLAIFMLKYCSDSIKVNQMTKPVIVIVATTSAIIGIFRVHIKSSPPCFSFFLEIRPFSSYGAN